MGVPEIKRETNVCAVKEWGVNEETITSKPGYEEASTVKHPLKNGIEQPGIKQPFESDGPNMSMHVGGKVR